MEKTSKKPLIIMLICVCVLFGGIFAFQAVKSRMIKKYMGAISPPAVVISATPVTYQSWQPKARVAGTLRAVNGVDVSAETNGLIRAIHFQSGAFVKANDLLVELNADPDIARLSALEAARDLSDTIYKRDLAQYNIKAISKASVDADAADLKDKQALVAQQIAVVAQKTIRAPFDGRLGISAVNVGQYITAGNKMVTLQALDSVYADFHMPQQALASLKTGHSVVLTTDTYPGRTFEGKITTIDPKVDPTTRNVQIEAIVPNPKSELLPGMFASVEVIIGEPKSYLTLPQTAVSFNPYGEVVFIVNESGKNKDGKPKLIATQTFVTTGDKRGDQVTVLKGLKEKQLIVTSGQMKLKNGSEVVINNQVVPSNNAKAVPVVHDE